MRSSITRSSLYTVSACLLSLGLGLIVPGSLATWAAGVIAVAAGIGMLLILVLTNPNPPE